MKTYTELRDLPEGFGPVVATIGNFDGVHRGHRWVIARVRARAAELGIGSAVVTFDPHPARVLRPEQTRPLLTPLTRKLELLEETGVDAVVVLPFSEALRQMSAYDFAREILRDRLRIAELHEGENFRFGYGAEADMQTLTTLGAELGFRVHGYAPERLMGGIVSSSRIRALVAEGEMAAARRLLGWTFAVDSTPAPGRGYGTRYAVPTINLATYDELLPAHGVYVTRMRVGGADSGPERWFEGVTNVGDRPTFGEDSFAVESYLLDFTPLELTERTPLRLEFLKRLRGEERWPTPEALKQQIGKDVARAERFFSLRRSLADGRPRSVAPPVQAGA